jgi:hypothetical protein
MMSLPAVAAAAQYREVVGGYTVPSATSRACAGQGLAAGAPFTVKVPSGTVNNRS